jgi:hypothetical protein
MNWQSIATGLPESDTTYNWTVPNFQTNSGQIKVIQDNITWHEDYSDISGDFTINATTGIDDPETTAELFLLYPAFPNPFNPTTTIRYDLSEGTRVSLTIYDITGAKVRTLVDDFQTQGEKSVQWDGRNDQGRIVSSGVYFYRMQAGNEVRLNKVTFLK